MEIEVKKHSPENGRAGVVSGELPAVGHSWATHRYEEAKALETLGAACKALVRYPNGVLVYVFDREDAEAHKGYVVRKAVAEQDAFDQLPPGAQDLMNWARAGK
jgi:hypothetical protein